LTVKFDVEQRLGLTNKLSPISLFQRIDRAGKGHLTKEDFMRFLNENGFRDGEGFIKQDLKLILKSSKVDFQT